MGGIWLDVVCRDERPEMGARLEGPGHGGGAVVEIAM
jgi:hypothetical protein